MKPYFVLNVSPQADDTTIRQAYLEAIREFPPDSAPQRFQAISEAYELIKDQARRRRYELFNRACPGNSPLEVLAFCGTHSRAVDPLPFEEFKKFLVAASGAKSGAKK